MRWLAEGSDENVADSTLPCAGGQRAALFCLRVVNAADLAVGQDAAHAVFQMTRFWDRRVHWVISTLSALFKNLNVAIKVSSGCQ